MRENIRKMPSVRRKAELMDYAKLGEPHLPEQPIGDFIFNDEVKKTLIKKSVAEKMNFRPAPYDYPTLKFRVKVGNKAVSAVGTSVLDFRIDGCFVSEQVYYVKDDEIDADVIVGTDIMNKYGIEIKKEKEKNGYVLDLKECRRNTTEHRIGRL